MSKIVKNLLLILVGFLLLLEFLPILAQDTKTTTVALSEIKDQINQGKVGCFVSEPKNTVVADIKDNNGVKDSAHIGQNTDVISALKDLGTDADKLKRSESRIQKRQHLE